MKILCVMGQHNYGDPARGEGYEFSNFLPALRRLGHQIIFFESFNRNRFRSFAELNRSLVEEVERERPDIVLSVLMGYEVWLETLDILRESGALLINWGTDDSWKYESFSRFIAPKVDVYVTTCHEVLVKARRDGLSNVVLSQWAANQDALREPLPAERCHYGVTFVGSAYGNRPRWIAELRKRGVDVECFGHGWPAGPIAAGDIATIVRESVISLNFADSAPHGIGIGHNGGRQIKARTFEVPGAGGFLLTEHVGRLNDYYGPGAEIAVFDGIDDLAGQIRHFTAHTELRDRVAIAGHHRTRLEHTYEARFRRLFERDVLRPKARAIVREFRSAAGTFEPLAQTHSVGPLLRALRACLVGACHLIWGRKRGARAARRLLFEICWRITGARTYAARGWPGRLFYSES